MHTIMQALRQTGRTTRMCQEVIFTAINNPDKQYDVVVVDPNHLPPLPFPSNVKIMTITDAIRDVFDIGLQVSMDYMQSGRIMYIDHAVYEKYHSVMLKELHRWDLFIRFGNPMENNEKEEQ